MISEEDTDKYLAEVLEILRAQFESGDKSRLLYAIYQCCLLRRPMPAWLQKAFIDAHNSATGYEIKSWDDAFGPPHPKKGAREKRRYFEFSDKIMQHIKEREMPLMRSYSRRSEEFSGLAVAQQSKIFITNIATNLTRKLFG
jgi:hypothetical protein